MHAELVDADGRPRWNHCRAVKCENDRRRREELRVLRQGRDGMHRETMVAVRRVDEDGAHEALQSWLALKVR